MTIRTLETSTVSIIGMDCADCARTLQRALESTDGVTSAAVRFESGTAVISRDPEIVSDDKLARVVEQAGYRIAAANTSVCHLTYDIKGMDCADCAKSAQAAVLKVQGVRQAEVRFETGVMVIEADPANIKTDRVLGAIESAGYKAVLRQESSRTTGDARPKLDRRLGEIVLASVLWAVAMVAEHAFGRSGIAVPLYLASIVIAGYRVARAARISLSVRRADMNLLMTAAAIGALILGDFSEASSLVVLFSLGIYLQSATLDRTRGAIKSLLDLTPATARKVVDGEAVTVPAAQLVVGDVVRVLPGERLPVDGLITDGISDLDQAQITGESRLRAVQVGDSIFAGSMNTSGVLTVSVTGSGSDTSLARIVEMVETAQSSKAEIQGTVERFAAIYTPSVLALAAVIAIGGGFVSGDWADWFYRGLILLVVACPCALIISTPVAYVSAIGRASKLGVLFKGGAALDGLGKIRTLAFDKTGTLTHGRPEVESIVASGRSEDEVLAIAAGLELGSTHPIARGIVRANSGSVAAVSGVTVIPGKGVRGELDGRTVTAGSRGLVSDLPFAIAEAASRAESDGKSTVLVGVDGLAIGLIVLSDSVRPISAGVVSDLVGMGVEPLVLSGDNEAVVRQLADSVGIERFKFGLLPDEKSAEIRRLAALGPIGMVGDGINDAPALAQATVGIAMGVGGSGAAIEAADVALMGDDLTKIPVSIHLARATQSIVVQNIAFALITKLAFVGLTVGGFTNLWLAVVADVGASLVVTLNAMRLR